MFIVVRSAFRLAPFTMDSRALQMPLILGLTLIVLVSCRHSNDSAIILTGIPLEFSGTNHLTAIQVSPRELANYTGPKPGLDFKDINKLPVSCDTDYEKHLLYYYDYGDRSVSILENFNTNLESMNDSVFQPAASKGFTLIAVDWVSHNVYWTEPILGRILLKKGGSSDRSTDHFVVVRNLKRPRGLAVDPLEGYIFWTDIQSKTIGRSSLIGENITLNLVYGGMSTPDSIVLDMPEKKLYWTDEKTIYSASYDGTGRQLFFRYSYAFFFDIGLIDDVIIASDVEKYYAFFIDKNTGKEVAPRMKSSTEAYYGVCTYQPRPEAPETQKDRCLDYGCPHICVSEPHKDEPTCVCYDGYALLNKKTCLAVGYPFYRGIVINTGSKLCIVGIQILSDHKDAEPVCFYTAPENKTISSFDLNMWTREAYFSIGNNIYSTMINTVSQSVRTLTTQNFEIYGLTYDWVDDLIYYALTTSASSSQPESIWRLDPDTLSTVVSQMETGKAPRAIAVSPHERKVFWITEGTSGNFDDYAVIEYTDLSLPATAKINVINTTYSLRNVTHMYHDIKSEALYLLERDSGFAYVTKMEYDGQFTSYVSVASEIADFAIYKDYVITGYKGVNDEEVTLETADISLTPIPNPVASGKLKGIKSFVGVRVLDYEALQPRYPDPCGNTKNKGGCEQICLPERSEAKCACNLGYILVNDKECKSYPVTDNFIVLADITYNEIFQIPLDDPNNIIALPTPVSFGRPAGVFYNYETEVVMFSNADYQQIWGVYLNGSADFLISDLGYKYPDRFAYDPSSQLLYFSAFQYFSFTSSASTGHIGVIDKEGRESIIHSLADNPRAIVVHPRKGLLFYTDHGSAGLYRMEMNGANWTPLIEGEEMVWPNGLAIDYREELLYWTDGYLDKIFSCDFNGTNRKTVYEDPDSHMMALELLDGYLYYSAWDKLKITKVKIDDTSDVTLIGPDHSIGRIHAMDIHISGKTDNVVPKNLVCSLDNGGCSHFCFPTATGRSCGCETDVALLNDGRTCENAPRCPVILLTATVADTDSCLRLGGNVCEFTCIKNYKPKAGVSTVTCTTMVDPDYSLWLLWDNDDPCEEIFCPMTIPNGALDFSCDRKVGSDCIDYTCDSGFEKNEDITSLICQENGTYEHQGPLCIARCPALTSTDHHAVLHPSCDRGIGDVCKYFCDDGFKSSISDNQIRCQPGSEWDAMINNICQEIFCPMTISNGAIDDSCDRKVGSDCINYTCDAGFEKDENITSLKCQNDGTYEHQDPLCIARCPALTSTDNHAVLHPSCDRGIGDVCKYFCDDGYRSSISYHQIRCQSGSEWDAIIDSLCQEITCNDFIEGGVINDTCSLKLGAECQYICDFRFQPNPNLPTVKCVGEGKWSHGGSETDLVCTEIPATLAAKEDNRKVALGVGLSVGLLVLLIIIVLFLIFLYRAGRLPLKKEPKEPVTSFENPRYTGDSVNIQPTEANKEFNYVTLEEENTSNL